MEVFAYASVVSYAGGRLVQLQGEGSKSNNKGREITITMTRGDIRVPNGLLQWQSFDIMRLKVRVCTSSLVLFHLKIVETPSFSSIVTNSEVATDS